jgi:hypothetical protein
MRLSELALLALVQIPNACLAGAGLYLAITFRTRGAILVAASLSLTLLLSIAGNILLAEMRTVFDESGQIAGAIAKEQSTLPFIILGYVSTGLRFVLALGIAMLAFEWRRRVSTAVSPYPSLERTRAR